MALLRIYTDQTISGHHPASRQPNTIKFPHKDHKLYYGGERQNTIKQERIPDQIIWEVKKRGARIQIPTIPYG